MPENLGNTSSFGIAFIVSYTLCGDVMAKDVSSPQTTELNAGARAPTLMKYVHIGQIESAAVISIAAAADKTYRKPILLGGILAIAVNELLYQYAKKQGLEKPGVPTEDHSNGNQEYSQA